jgi:aryl carrier-like protein
MMNDEIDTNKIKIMFSLLKIMRANLIQDFLDHIPDIYRPSFKYENERQLLLLSIEKYFMTWLNSYWHIFEDKIEKLASQDMKEELKYDADFIQLYMSLLKQWQIEGNHLQFSELMQTLLNQKIQGLNHILEMGEKSQKQYNQLQLQYEKDKAIFERTIKQLGD